MRTSDIKQRRGRARSTTVIDAAIGRLDGYRSYNAARVEELLIDLCQLRFEPQICLSRKAASCAARHAVKAITDTMKDHYEASLKCEQPAILCAYCGKDLSNVERFYRRKQSGDKKFTWPICSKTCHIMSQIDLPTHGLSDEEKEMFNHKDEYNESNS